MSPDDAGVVLATMRAMWPGHTLTDDQVVIWVDHFRSVDFDDAQAVLGVIERTSRFWPHWSVFLAVYEPILRRRNEADANQRSLGTGEACTAEENAVWVEHCRDILRNAKGPLAKGLRGVIR